MFRGRFRFPRILLYRSCRSFPGPAFPCAFNFPEAVFGRRCARAAVGTRQKPKIIRPTSCQVLLVIINHQAGTRSGPWWQRGRVLHSRSTEATPSNPWGPSLPRLGLPPRLCSPRSGSPELSPPPPGSPLHSPSWPRRRPPHPRIPSHCTQNRQHPAQAECVVRLAAYP